MVEQWTVKKLLDWSSSFFKSHGIDNARFDAECLLSKVLGLDRVGLYLAYDRPVDAKELACYKSFIIRRSKDRVPVAYLVGERGFWSLDLKVSPAVLIPRPDSESLIEFVLKHKLLLLSSFEKLRMVDVGTGSGALALALAYEFKGENVEVIGVDVSEAALEVACCNAEKHGLDVLWRCGDLLEGLEGDFGLVISNPPYIAEWEMEKLSAEVHQEPVLALVGGVDGLDVIRRLTLQAKEKLCVGGLFVCEIGYKQGEEVRQIVELAGFEGVGVGQDYGGCDRYVYGFRV